MEKEKETKKKGKKGTKSKVAADDDKASATEEKDPGILIEDVKRITINAITQKILNCVVGEHVTSEVPWTFVSKETVEDNLDMHQESSDFLPIRNEILQFTKSKILVGYNATADEENQFYVCVSHSAEKSVLDILAQVKAEQELKIKNAINKKVGIWKSLGSEIEVDESIIHNNRPLMEVEVETKMRQLQTPADFTDRDTGDVADGWCQFALPRHVYDTVKRKRFDTGVQAFPLYFDREAQTVPGLPSNVYTQYEFYVDIDKQLDDIQVVEHLDTFLQNRSEEMEEQLEFNTIFDLHNNDYELLAKSVKDTKVPESIAFTEYQSLMDVKYVSDKLISCASWHPMWTGIVALAYTKTTRNQMKNETQKPQDEVQDAIFEKNRVLIWSLTDTLKPKLILETPREVHALKFCPFNANLLIGGCINGHVVLWDITNKLDEVETVEKLTEKQEKYNRLMEAHLEWMKKARSATHVHPTALSAIETSHSKCITDIQWINPYWSLNKSGRYQVLPDEEEGSLQFLTCSEDGFVHFWDLNATNYEQQVVVTKLKKKKKKVAGAKIESPFQKLNLLFCPIFSLKILFPDTQIRAPLSSLSLNMPAIPYDVGENGPALQMTDRVIYTPDLRRPEGLDVPPLEFFAGTLDGSVLKIKWEGFEFTPSDAIPCEVGKIVSIGEEHDGPVFAARRSPFLSELVLTVGGKTFALWRDDLPNTPLFSRRSPQFLTSAMWSSFRPSMFTVARTDGTIEVWDLFQYSHKPTLVQSISSNPITGMYYHNLSLPDNIVGFAESNGAFRLFSTPAQYIHCDDGDAAKLRAYFDREIDRNQEMGKWRDDWRVRHADVIREGIENEEERKRQEELAGAELAARELEVRRAMERDMKKLAKERAEIAKREAGQDQWNALQGEYLSGIILDKKKIDKADLIIKREPLIGVREKKAEKARKVKERLIDQAKIFDESVAGLFPETVAKPLDDSSETQLLKVYATTQDEVESAKKFEAISAYVLDYRNKNPYRPNLTLIQILNDGRKRQFALDHALVAKSKRQNRFTQRFAKKKVEEEPVETVEVTEETETPVPVSNDQVIENEEKKVVGGTAVEEDEDD